MTQQEFQKIKDRDEACKAGRRIRDAGQFAERDRSTLIAEIERLWNRDFKAVGKEALAKAIDPNAALVTKLSALLVEMEAAGFEIAVETNTHMQTWQEWEAHPVAVIKVKNCEVGCIDDPTSLRYLCLPE